MPSYNDTLTLTVHSQYDAVPIPELLTSPPKDQPQLNQSQNHGDTVNILIPHLPKSQFWLSYHCCPPLQDQPTGVSFRYYFFKLFVRGRCALSWGAGPAEAWSGKTVFGLFNGGLRDFGCGRIVERRGFFFPNAVAGGLAEGFEVKVYRAKARRSREVAYERCERAAFRETEGLVLTRIGSKHRGERHRLYEYALLDPKDRPFVSFRYRFCEQGHFNRLFELSEDGCVSANNASDQAATQQREGEELLLTTIPIALSPSVPASSARSSPPRSQVQADTPTKPLLRCRLSFPPRTLLGATSSHPRLPGSPTKQPTSSPEPTKHSPFSPPGPTKKSPILPPKPLSSHPVTLSPPTQHLRRPSQTGLSPAHHPTQQLRLPNPSPPPNPYRRNTGLRRPRPVPLDLHTKQLPRTPSPTSTSSEENSSEEDKRGSGCFNLTLPTSPTSSRSRTATSKDTCTPLSSPHSKKIAGNGGRGRKREWLRGLVEHALRRKESGDSYGTGTGMSWGSVRSKGSGNLRGRYT